MADKGDSQALEGSLVEDTQTVAEPHVEDSQPMEEDILSQETLNLSPNLHSPLPGSPAPPNNDDEADQSDDDDGRITPPIGMVIAADGTVHGDPSFLGDPMAMSIMNVLSGFMLSRLDAKGKGKGKDVNGEAPAATSSSQAEPKAKCKATPKRGSKKSKFSKK